MSQDPMQGDWQDWTATPQPRPTGTDPQDPLISNDYAGWWHRSFWLLRTGWRPMALVQLIVAVPMLVLTLPALLSFERQQKVAQDSLQASLDANGEPDFSLIFAGVPVLLSAALVASLFYVLGQLTTAQLVVSMATGRTGNRPGAALLAAARRVPALLGWYLLAIPLCLVAFIACFVPVIYVSAVITILPVVVLLERGQGIGRCFQLFHANFGVSVSRIATMMGLYFAGSVVLALLTTIVSLTIGGSYESPNTTATVINGILQCAYYFASGLVITPMVVTAYADMRAHREHFTTAHLIPDAR